MNKSKRARNTLIGIGITVIIIGMAGYLTYQYLDRQERRQRFSRQVGTYVLDIKKTELGGYKKDVALYRNLYITFNADSTFMLSMDVPFMYDSSGTWRVGGGGLEDWSWMQFGSAGFEEQFAECCMPDSTFYLSRPTPKEDRERIQGIYFKRINH